MPSTPAGPARDVPVLYPAYFSQLLAASGTPVTPANMARLVERTAVMIGSQGAKYLARQRDAAAFEAFVRAFARGGRPERRPHLVDDIVDWLWAWSPACHDDLRARFTMWGNDLRRSGGLLSGGGDLDAFFEDEEHPDYESIWRTIYTGNLPAPADEPPQVDIGQILADGIDSKQRLHLLKRIGSSVWTSGRGRDLAGLAERGAQLLHGSLARLPVRDKATLHHVYGADDESAADRLIEAAAAQAGWLWAGAAALPVPPPAAHALKAVLHSLIELRLIAELYSIYGPQPPDGVRDAAWLNTVVHAWAVGHPVAAGPTPVLSVRDLAVKLRSAFASLDSDGRPARFVHRGRDGRELIRGLGSRLRRRMRYHPDTWPRLEGMSAARVLTAVAADTVRGRIGLRQADEAEDEGAPGEHFHQAWAHHLSARATIQAAGGTGQHPTLVRLNSALDAQRQRLDWLAGRMGVKPVSTPPKDLTGQHDPARAAHCAAELADRAIDRIEAAGSRPRRLPDWPPLARNGLVYFAVSLAFAVMAGWLGNALLDGQNPGLGTAALLMLPLCGTGTMAYGIGILAVGRLFRPWLEGPTPRSPIAGLLITSAMLVLVPAAMAFALP